MIDETTDDNDDRSKYRPHNLRGGRPSMFPEYDGTEQRKVTLPLDFWGWLDDVYGHHGRYAASLGIADIVKQWHDARDNDSQ